MTRRLFFISLATVAVLASALLVWRARTKSVRGASLPMNAGYKVSATEELHLARLANAGDSAAAFALAEAFSIGTPDYEKHRVWLKRAAELGHVVAEYNFGYLLWREGRFTEARRRLLTARAHAEQTGDTFTAHLATGVLAALPESDPAADAPDAHIVPTFAIPDRHTPK
jgi:TPR repeat protein